IMKIETLQTISQVIIAVGIILTALGGYGSYHFGKKVNANSDLQKDEKIEQISHDINEGKNQVLDSIGGLKNSIIEAIDSDGTRIKRLSFPVKGEFGPNILDKTIIEGKPGTYSMRVELPKNEKIKVKVSGSNWVFPLFQSIPGWKFSDLEKESGGKYFRYFESVKHGIIDFEIKLETPGELHISVYENDFEKISWEKTLVIEK